MSPIQLKVYNKLVVWLLHTENCGSKESTLLCYSGTKRTPQVQQPTLWWYCARSDDTYSFNKTQVTTTSTIPTTILIYTSLLLRYKANPASTTASTTAVPSTWYCTKRTPQVQQLNSTVVPNTWYQVLCVTRRQLPAQPAYLFKTSTVQLYQANPTGKRTRH